MTTTTTTTAPAVVADASDATTKAVVLQIRADMRGAARYSAYVEAHGVTRENVNGHAAALAALVTPVTAQKDKDGQRTRYGNALNTAKTGLKRALPTEDGDKPVVLRASLSGEGGGSTVIEPSHPLYADIVALISGNES